MRDRVGSSRRAPRGGSHVYGRDAARRTHFAFCTAKAARWRPFAVREPLHVGHGTGGCYRVVKRERRIRPTTAVVEPPGGSSTTVGRPDTSAVKGAVYCQPSRRTGPSLMSLPLLTLVWPVSLRWRLAGRCSVRDWAPARPWAYTNPATEDRRAPFRARRPCRSLWIVGRWLSLSQTQPGARPSR